MRIVLIVTYFGKLPFWFPAFQVSCKYNPEIKWLIFSDTPQPLGCPENLIFIPFSIEKFCDLASKKLGVQINLSANFLYKLCDFKPAFGLIYEDYLGGYDFWGHCDIDIIWGKITNHITEDLLEKYDILTSRKKRISGHFCLYRNTNKKNRIILNISHLKHFLQDYNKCHRIDEEHLSLYLNKLTSSKCLYWIKKNLLKKETPRIFWDQVLTTSGSHQRAMIKKSGGFFEWKKGIVYNIKGYEIMYLHFHVLKTLPSFTICNINPEDNKILLTPQGITSSK